MSLCVVSCATGAADLLADHSSVSDIAIRIFPAQSKYLVTGAADNTMRLWEVCNGKCLYTWEFPTAVKRVGFSTDDSKIVCITEERMGYQSFVRVFEVNRSDPARQSKSPLSEFSPPGSKPTVCSFTFDGNAILTGHENGNIALWDMVTGEELEGSKPHNDTINDMQLSPDKSYLITASRDKTAKVRSVNARIDVLSHILPLHYSFMMRTL